MTINGHLLLLVLATGFFVRVWNGNGATQLGRVTRTNSHKANVCLTSLAPLTTQNVVVHQPISVATTNAPAEENWTTADCPVPLPAGITPGTYRMVDDTGRVARLVVAEADVAVTGTNRREVPADFHLLTIGGRRWYFIRLQSPVAVDVREGTENASSEPTTGTADNACLFRNRKFDFTGYVMPGQQEATIAGETAVGRSPVDASSSDRVARPDSPELPLPL